MWFRVSVFSARLFDSHRVTCYGIRVEGGLRVMRLCVFSSSLLLEPGGTSSSLSIREGRTAVLF